MNPGKLDRRIVIQELVTTRSQSGAVISTWMESDTVSAQKLQSSGRESQQAAARRVDMDQVFRIRYYDGLSEKSHRFLFEDRLFDILDITEEDRKVSMLVTCKFTEGRS